MSEEQLARLEAVIRGMEQSAESTWLSGDVRTAAAIWAAALRGALGQPANR